MRYLLLLTLLAVPGCSLLGQPRTIPGEAYVDADRETLEAMKLYAPTIEEAAPFEAAMFNATLRSWEARVEAAENRYAAMRGER